MILVDFNTNDHMVYDIILGNRTIVTFDTNLNL